MKGLKALNREISIKIRIISFFMVFIILTVGIIGLILFSNLDSLMYKIGSDSGIIKNIKLTLFMAILALLASLIVFLRFINNYLKPMDSLLFVCDKFSKGNLSQKVKIYRKDEVERISEAFNLRLILDSTAEGIFGLDKAGNCSFCNASCLKILGYENENQLIGKNMYLLTHHFNKKEWDIFSGKGRNFLVFSIGRAVHGMEAVFCRADGTGIDVEYFSYPQKKDDEIVGAVVNFRDITKRKEAEERIKYLSYHDSLTGLYNRMFFEEELKRLDTERNLPISIIIGDVNNLKLTNDIFGHSVGDDLLKKVADILRKSCREDDIIARMGGDEFVILLPKTGEPEADSIVERIKDLFFKEKSYAVQGSISMGIGVKKSNEQNIKAVIKEAEDKMYFEKALNRKAFEREHIKTIIDTLHKRSPIEKTHSENVSNISEKIGMAIPLEDADIKKLTEASYYHDIGKISLDEAHSDDYYIRDHSVIGYRILNCFDDTLDLAEYILSHHECWDGTGYPEGLKGQEIPKISRILAVAGAFDSVSNRLSENSISKEEAVEMIKKQAGAKFDPKIVDVFVNVVNEHL